MTTVDLNEPRAIHIVGVGGAGMSAIATVLAAMGHRVSGSDMKPSPGLDRLRAEGVEVVVGHDAGNVGAVDAVAISTAIPASNPEVEAAKAAGIPVLRRADVLAAIVATRRTLAVAGTHGKTTTSSMLALVLVEAGVRPSFIVGGEVNEIGGGALWADGEWFVVEADESDGTFLELTHEVGIVTSVEPDHLEHYGGFDGVCAAFGRFIADSSGVAVVCADDEWARALGTAHGARQYGTSESADYRMVDISLGRSHAAFTLVRDGAELGRIELPVPGLHNARNAAAAATAALEIGVPMDAVSRALARYGGVARRFQFRGERDGVTFVDDYAHLPTEVVEALRAARTGGWDRIVCVFQPHRYSRTEELADAFADSFAAADVVVITDVYASGEAPRPGVSGRLIADAVTGGHPDSPVLYVPGRRDLAEAVRPLLLPGDLCLTLGAGDITSLPDELAGTGNSAAG